MKNLNYRIITLLLLIIGSSTNYSTCNIIQEISNYLRPMIVTSIATMGCFKYRHQRNLSVLLGLSAAGYLGYDIHSSSDNLKSLASKYFLSAITVYITNKLINTIPAAVIPGGIPDPAPVPEREPLIDHSDFD